MNEGALMTGLVGAGEKIDTLWNMFITVHMAIFGFYLLNRRQLGWSEVVVAFIGYLGFAWINANALIYTYELLNGYHAQFRIQYDGTGKLAKTLYAGIIEKDFSNRATIVWSVHSAATVIVAVALYNLCGRPDLMERLTGTSDAKPSSTGSSEAWQEGRQTGTPDATVSAEPSHNEAVQASPPPNPYKPPEEKPQSTDAADAHPDHVPGYVPGAQVSGVPDPKDVNPDPVLTDELARALRRAQTNAHSAKKDVHTSERSATPAVPAKTQVDAEYRPPKDATKQPTNGRETSRG